MVKPLAIFMLVATLGNHVATVNAGNTSGIYQYLVECMEYAKASVGQPSEKQTPEMQRNKGTFWSATEVLDLAAAVNRPADKDGWNGECGVAFYYDDMARRLKSLQLRKEAVTTYAKPLAIAPVCEGDAKPKADSKYPESSSDGNRFTFEQYRPAPEGGTKNDAYFILQNAKNADADCLTLEDFGSIQWQFPDKDQAVIQEFWQKDSQKGNGVPEFTPDLFKDWVMQYARDGRDGTICIPNPRKFGKGNIKWSSWNWLSTMWGYKDDDTWNTDPPAGSSRKRSRIEGPL